MLAGMGDVTRVEFTAKTIRDLARLVGAEVANAIDKTPPAPGAAPAASPAFEPWTLTFPEGASGKFVTRAAYVDDANQQRWVPVDQSADVPAPWKLLFVRTDEA